MTTIRMGRRSHAVPTSLVDHRRNPIPKPLDLSFRGVAQLYDFLDALPRGETPAFQTLSVHVPDRVVDGESSDEEPSADEAVSVTPRGRGKTERYKQAQKTAQDRRKQRKKRRRLEEAAKQKRDPSNKDADITAAAEERRKKKKMEKRQKEAEQQDLLDDEEKKVKKAKNVKQYTTNILKLNNNKLMDLDNLVPHLSALVMQPDMIVWLDLSFNSLDDIDPALAILVNLVRLNLHGNQIADVRDTEILSAIVGLRRFTLHANPCARLPLYRETVLTVLPGLTNLDFTGVTKEDRAGASEWYNSAGKFQVMTPAEMEKLVADRERAEAVKGRVSADEESSDPDEYDDDEKIDPAEEKAALRKQQKMETGGLDIFA